MAYLIVSDQMEVMQEEFVAGSTKGKLIFFGLLLVAIVCLLLINPVQDFLDSRNQTLADSDPKLAFEYSLQQLLVITIVSTIWMWGLSYYFFRLGLRVKKAGRVPVPNQCMPFRTKVRRGMHAKVTYISLFIFAGVLVIHPLIKLYAWHAISQLTKDLISPNKPLKKDLGDATRPSAS